MNKLNNITNKLKNQKKATVVYLGGSVTNGFGSTNANEKSWRALSGKYFKESFPDADITLVNAGVGGTGTGYARFRLQKDVLDYNPDLVFIEFSINDSYDGCGVAESEFYYESLIHTINANNPQTDIVMVVITDRGNMRNGSSAIAAAHYALAQYYGIPVIDVLGAVANDMKCNSEHNEDYFLTDWAHPNDTGYAFYADVVNEFINNEIVNADYSDLIAHKLPAAKSKNIVVGKTENILFNYMKFSDLNGFKIKDISNNDSWLVSENAYDSIEFNFNCSHFSALVHIGPMLDYKDGADEIECYLDGELVKTLSMKNWSGASVHRTFFNGADNKLHNIKIVNKSGGPFGFKRFYFA